MAPHIVTWGLDKDKRSISPVPSTVGSIVSIESMTSDPSIISHSVPEVSRRSTDFMRYKVPPDVHLAVDSPFVRHEKYFFQDGNITFLIDGTLYCVHRYFFSRDSEYFSNRLTQLGIRKHEALSIIISLGDVERKDFEAFLSVIYPDDFEGHALSYEEWKSVLHLSTRWGFASLRRLALGSIEPPTPFDQLLLARAYSVDHWLLPALSALCERTVPLSLSEVRQMSIEDVVLVTTVREDIRHHALQVDPAEIPHCIEAAQAGMVAIAAASARGKAEAPSNSPSSSGSESSTGSTAAFAAKYNYKLDDAAAEVEDDDDATTAVAISPMDMRRPGKDGGVGQLANPVPIRPAERSASRATWGKILVVPSPTHSVQPHLPGWGPDSGHHHESHDPSAWRRLRVKTSRRFNPGSDRSALAGDALSDEERD
ncbi:hypothetical protein EDB92DRAFT_1842645 [Lactarius akahatsu]|uniref:BTB domain-containing protein n=1 Tax=Lactarius akahatsu TaxID=416441 RepID=A0AAD4QAS7_9AGAM|nr:hypothetical protein EDB92DRAFT_1842645 [Lactarius akahatsu]